MTAARKLSKPGKLAEYEKVIDDAVRSFVEVGAALARIRDDDLFVEDGYETFDAYCRERWEFTRGRADQLIRSAELVSTIVLKKLPPPSNEAQVRELAKAPEETQPKVWAEVVKTAPEGVITAKHVAAVVAGFRPVEKKREAKPKPETEEEPDPAPAATGTAEGTR